MRSEGSTKSAGRQPLFRRLAAAVRAFGLVSAICLALAPVLGSAAMAQAPAPATAVTVYKSPYCGCCGKWVDYLRGHGFDVTVHDMEDLTALKTMAGVPARLQSCHTAMTGGYVLEGHVPVDAIRSLLDSGAKVQGLAVPGMPAGSPGMEGGPPEAYTVYSFAGDGSAEPFMSFPAR